MAVGDKDSQPRASQHLQGNLGYDGNNINGAAGGHVVGNVIGKQINITGHISKEVIKELTTGLNDPKDPKSNVRIYNDRIAIIVRSIRLLVSSIDQLSSVANELSADKKVELQDVEQFLTQLNHIQDMLKDIKDKIKFRIWQEHYSTDLEADLQIIAAEVDMRKNELNLATQKFQLKIHGTRDSSSADIEKSTASKEESLLQEKFSFQIMRYYGPGPLFIPPPNLRPLSPPFLYDYAPASMDPAAYSGKCRHPMYACWSLRKRSRIRTSPSSWDSKTSWKYHERELLQISSRELRYEVNWQRKVIGTPEDRVMHKIHGIKSRRQRDAIHHLLQDENMELQKYDARLIWVIAGIHFQEEKYGGFGFRKSDTVAMLLVLRAQSSLFDGISRAIGRTGTIRSNPLRPFPGDLSFHPGSDDGTSSSTGGGGGGGSSSRSKKQRHAVQPPETPPSRYEQSLPRPSHSSTSIHKRHSSLSATQHYPHAVGASLWRPHSSLESIRPTYVSSFIESSDLNRASESPGDRMPTRHQIRWRDPDHTTVVASSSRHPNLGSNSGKGKGRYQARVSDYEPSSDSGRENGVPYDSNDESGFWMEDEYQSALHEIAVLPPRRNPPMGLSSGRPEAPWQPPPPPSYHQEDPILIPSRATRSQQGLPVPLIPRPGWDAARFAELDQEVPPPVVNPGSPNFQRDLQIMLHNARERSTSYTKSARIQMRERDAPYYVQTSRPLRNRSDRDTRSDEAKEQAWYYAEDPRLEMREREYLPPEPAFIRRHSQREWSPQHLYVQERPQDYTSRRSSGRTYSPSREYRSVRRRSASRRPRRSRMESPLWEITEPHADRSSREHRRAHVTPVPIEYTSRRVRAPRMVPVFREMAPARADQSHSERRRSRMIPVPNEHISQRTSSPQRASRGPEYAWTRRRRPSSRGRSPRRQIMMFH